LLTTTIIIIICNLCHFSYIEIFEKRRKEYYTNGLENYKNDEVGNAF
jgi:hypothetical protein